MEDDGYQKESRWHDCRYILHAWWQAAGYEKVRQGNIHFAGEHCSYNFQGYMEGGAEEGKRAANEVLRDYHII